jgi:hypothetical protein
VYWGPYLHSNKNVNVDKITHIFIVLVLPTKSVLKKMLYTTYIDLHGARATAQRAHVLRSHWVLE